MAIAPYERPDQSKLHAAIEAAIQRAKAVLQRFGQSDWARAVKESDLTFPLAKLVGLESQCKSQWDKGVYALVGPVVHSLQKTKSFLKACREYIRLSNTSKIVELQPLVEEVLALLRR